MRRFNHQELRAIILKKYGGKCKTCKQTAPEKLNVVMVGGTEEQQREYQALRKQGINAPLRFLYDRFFPKTHVLVCTACARKYGGFRYVGQHYKFMVVSRGIPVSRKLDDQGEPLQQEQGEV